MKHFLYCWPLIVGLFASVFCISCASQTPQNTFVSNWKSKRATLNLPATMLALLDTIEAKNPDRLSILRTSSKAPHRLQTCFPFEKSHQSGRAVDVAVGDWNNDGGVDLLDACLLASTLESRGWRGNLGLYGHKTGQKSTFWVHCDADGNERWGGLREDNKSGAQPIIWSLKNQPYPRDVKK